MSGSVLHLSPEVCALAERCKKRTAARRYKCMHLRVPSSPVPAGVHLQKAAKTNRSTQVQVHASPGPFFTCPRRCALAEGCKNEPQHASVRSCISESVLHLSPEVCTCRRLQKRTAARGLSHELFTLGGRCAGGVPLRERQMQGLCSDPSRCVCADGGSIKNAKCND